MPGLRNEIVETSGDAVLLRVFDPDQVTLTFAVADSKRKTLVRLQGLVPTLAGFAHLAPGGSAVYVEEATGTIKASVKDGKAFLYDAATGRRSREIEDPRIPSLYFLSITPMGQVVYFGNERYSTVNLRLRFSTDVVRTSHSKAPAYFVAH